MFSFHFSLATSMTNSIEPKFSQTLYCIYGAWDTPSENTVFKNYLTKRGWLYPSFKYLRFALKNLQLKVKISNGGGTLRNGLVLFIQWVERWVLSLWLNLQGAHTHTYFVWTDYGSLFSCPRKLLQTHSSLFPINNENPSMLTRLSSQTLKTWDMVIQYVSRRKCT